MTAGGDAGAAARTAPGRLPVVLLTGFLGSGKTTVLNRLLRERALDGTAVIVNEVGAVGIDHLLVARGAEDTVLLDGGCVCCAQRGSLAATVDGLLRRRADGRLPAFARIVVETSGLADPVPVIGALIAEPGLARRCWLRRVVTTVDLVGGAATLATHPEAVAQAAVADVLLLTKGDLAGGAARAATAAALDGLGAPGERVDAGALDAGVLLGGGTGAVRRRLACSGGGGDVQVSALAFEGVLGRDVVEAWVEDVMGRLGATLIRFKAVLSVAGMARPLVLHGTQHLLHAPAELADAGEGVGRNRVLLVARGGDGWLLDDAVRGLAGAAAA